MFDALHNFGVLNILTGVVELTVPSYGLRLVRRYGTQQVGWFIVAAFISLSLLHLTQWTRSPASPPPGLSSELTYIFACGLLLIGMGHLETLNRQRERSDSQQEQAEVQTSTRSRDAANRNQELLLQICLLHAEISSLTTADSLYRYSFEENPPPMWVVDLSSGRFLAVNDSAVSQYGFTRQEFLQLSLSDLVPISASSAVQHDLAQPCLGRASQGIWQHRRKDGTVFEVQTTAVDLKWEAQFGRLMVAQRVPVPGLAEAQAGILPLFAEAQAGIPPLPPDGRGPG